MNHFMCRDCHQAELVDAQNSKYACHDQPPVVIQVLLDNRTFWQRLRNVKNFQVDVSHRAYPLVNPTDSCSHFTRRIERINRIEKKT